MLKVTKNKIDLDKILIEYFKEEEKRFYSAVGTWDGDWYDDPYDVDWRKYMHGGSSKNDWYDDYKKYKGNKKKDKKSKSRNTLVWDKNSKRFQDVSSCRNWDDYVAMNQYNPDDDIPLDDERAYLDDSSLFGTCYEDKDEDTSRVSEIRKNKIQVSGAIYKSRDKYIYYYPNVLKKDSRQEFHSIAELDEYLTATDIEIPDSEIHKLVKLNTVHCTQKYNKELNTFELVVDNSYGSLVFECEAITSNKTEHEGRWSE